MSDHCFDWAEFDDLLDLDPSDPRQQHLAECPLCRARLSAYRAFLAKTPLAVDSRQEEAEDHLERFIAEQRSGEEPVAKHGASAGEGTKQRAKILQLFRPMRWALPVAAAAAILAVLIVRGPLQEAERSAQHRLRSADTTEVSLAALRGSATLGPDQTIVFRWPTWPGADSYQIQLFTPKLEEIARFTAGGDTLLKIRSVEIPAEMGPILWRVQALREGDEIAHSAPEALDLPRRQ